MGAVWALGRCGKIGLGAILGQICLRGGCLRAATPGDDNENVPNNPVDSKNMDYCNNKTGRDCGKTPMGVYSYILGCTVCCAGSPLKIL